MSSIFLWLIYLYCLYSAIQGKSRHHPQSADNGWNPWMPHQIVFEISIHGPNEFLHVGPLDNSMSDKNTLKKVVIVAVMDAFWLSSLWAMKMSSFMQMCRHSRQVLITKITHGEEHEALSGWKAAPAHTLVTSVLKPSALQSLIFLLFSLLRTNKNNLPLIEMQAVQRLKGLEHLTVSPSGLASPSAPPHRLINQL